MSKGVKWGKLDMKSKPLWEFECKDAVSMARCKNAILYLGYTNLTPLLEAIDINNGEKLWSRELISPPIPWGLIVDRDGRTIVTLKDGQIMCFGQRSTI